MKNVAVIIILFLTPVGWHEVQNLTFAEFTGIALTMFSGFFIFTVMTAKTPIQFQWKPQVTISPEVKEHLNNAAKLVGTLIIFFVAAVILVAIAATGQDLSLPDALLMVVKSLPRMLDV